MAVDAVSMRHQYNKKRLVTLLFRMVSSHYTRRRTAAHSPSTNPNEAPRCQRVLLRCQLRLVPRIRPRSGWPSTSRRPTCRSSSTGLACHPRPARASSGTPKSARLRHAIYDGCSPRRRRRRRRLRRAPRAEAPDGTGARLRHRAGVLQAEAGGGRHYRPSRSSQRPRLTPSSTSRHGPAQFEAFFEDYS